METLSVQCPGCESVLIVNRRTGEVLEVRKPLLNDKERTGDRFEDARKKATSLGERAEMKFNAVKEAEKDKFAKLDALFEERKREIAESGEAIDRPASPFDND